MATTASGHINSRLFYVHDNFPGLGFLIGTGAEAIATPQGKSTRGLKPAEYALQMANNPKIMSYGRHLLTVDLGLHQSFPWIIVGVQHPIIGVDFLTKYGLAIDLSY
ncbi:hypothetical protein PHET_12354 [Paragonimus heterotremus]|uniref:Uncharacterized protein n=1 Tax=Paragonimus heterotremus TaxID=100268 RepID=A0A8J4SXT1_9TREM|nr:hypothetical protein PHET_12354 [Paragonimus heterotremus]